MRIAIALVLAAVVIPGSAGARHHHVAPVLPIGQSASYRCADGRTIELLFAGDGSALLTAGGKTATLKPTDRSGAHFEGDDWRWTSSSATAGVLARAGSAEANARGTVCTVG